MINKTFDRMLADFQQERDTILEQVSEPLERFRSIAPVISNHLKKLRAYVLANPFTSESEEINFYKRIKPRIYSELILESFRFNLFHNKPAGPEVAIQAYWNDELELIQRFYKVNAFSYQYYKMNFKQLDEEFFLVSKHSDIPGSETILIDPVFSTSMDYQFAKFMAYEQLQALILTELNIGQPADASVKLNWTGDSINLVELAYGIWLTGQVNYGNSSITEIIQFLEESFMVKIGRPYRRWTSISGRKRLSPTKFLDQMKVAIMDRLENELK